MITHINLLLFSTKNLLFGVYAEQVEEFLEAGEFPELEEHKTEATLSFRGRNMRLLHFSRCLQLEEHRESIRPLEFQTHDLTSALSPRILIVRCCHGDYMGVWIENLKKLLTVSIDHIHSLPLIMKKNKRIPGLWGFVLVENRPVILIDLEQL